MGSMRNRESNREKKKETRATRNSGNVGKLGSSKKWRTEITQEAEVEVKNNNKKKMREP